MRQFIAFLIALCVAVSGHAAPDAVNKLSFVLLAQPRLPAADAYRAALEARLKGRVRIDGMEGGDGQAILLRTRGGTAMVGLIDAPLPKGQVDDLCRSAWYWKDACAAVGRHRAHAVVMLMGLDLDRLDTALLLTDMVAALMDDDDNAIASYWLASLQSRQAVLDQSRHISRESPPVWLWVNFRLSGSRAQGWSLSTEGLDAFGLMEIETRDAKRSGADVFGMVADTASYLIHKGAVIKDGDTLGDSPAMDIRVTHSPSYWREGKRVYRITFP
jgi:hypothetical protein